MFFTCILLKRKRIYYYAIPTILTLSELSDMDEQQESSTCDADRHDHCNRSSSSGPPPCNGAPEHRTLLRTSESHGLQLLTMLRSFRERGLMSDFTIKVQGQTLPCHRCVLAACSDFFRYISSSLRLELSEIPSLGGRILTNGLLLQSYV